MAEAIMLAGTRKGLFIGRSDEARGQWSWDKPQFSMQKIYSAAIDVRGDTPRLFAGATSPHWGPQVFHSDDLGRTWTETKGGAIRFPEDTGTALERIWQLAPAPADQPDVIFAGTEPSALFKSTDRGGS